MRDALREWVAGECNYITWVRMEDMLEYQGDDTP